MRPFLGWKETTRRTRIIDNFWIAQNGAGFNREYKFQVWIILSECYQSMLNRFTDGVRYPLYDKFRQKFVRKQKRGPKKQPKKTKQKPKYPTRRPSKPSRRCAAKWFYCKGKTDCCYGWWCGRPITCNWKDFDASRHKHMCPSHLENVLLTGIHAQDETSAVMEGDA